MAERTCDKPETAKNAIAAEDKARTLTTALWQAGEALVRAESIIHDLRMAEHADAAWLIAMDYDRLHTTHDQTRTALAAIRGLGLGTP